VLHFVTKKGLFISNNVCKLYYNEGNNPKFFEKNVKKMKKKA